MSCPGDEHPVGAAPVPAGGGALGGHRLPHHRRLLRGPPAPAGLAQPPGPPVPLGTTTIII